MNDDLMQPVAWMNAKRDMTYLYGPYNADDTPLYTAEQAREYAKRAVDAEREACAQAGKEALKLHASLGVVVENAIRARGNT